MAKYLIKTTEIYRCDTETEAEQLIDESKKAMAYTLIKSTSEAKDNKKTGDNWVRVTLTKVFTDEKEPAETISVSYEVE